MCGAIGTRVSIPRRVTGASRHIDSFSTSCQEKNKTTSKQHTSHLIRSFCSYRSCNGKGPGFQPLFPFSPAQALPCQAPATASCNVDHQSRTRLCSCQLSCFWEPGSHFSQARPHREFLAPAFHATDKGGRERFPGYQNAVRSQTSKHTQTLCLQPAKMAAPNCHY